MKLYRIHYLLLFILIALPLSVRPLLAQEEDKAAEAPAGSESNEAPRKIRPIRPIRPANTNNAETNAAPPPRRALARTNRTQTASPPTTAGNEDSAPMSRIPATETINVAEPAGDQSETAPDADVAAQTQPSEETGDPENAAEAGEEEGPTTASPSNMAQQTEMVLSNPDEIVAYQLLKYENMPLEQFLDIYAEFVERTLLRPTSLPGTQINLKAQTPLTRKEAVEAMDSVLALNGITMIPTGEKFVTAVTTQDAPAQGAAFTDKDAEDLPEASQYVTQIVQLKELPAEEVVNAITPFAKNPAGIIALETSRVVILRDFAINVKRMMEIIEKIDRKPPKDWELKPEVLNIKYAQATDIAQVIGSLSPSGVTASIGTSARANAPGAAGGRSSRAGIGGLNSRNTQSNLSNRSTTSSARSSGSSSFQNRLNQLVSRAADTGDLQILGELHMIPDERTNSILIFATEKDMEMIKSIVEKLDVVLAQVLIESIILEASVNDSLDFGLNMTHGPVNAGEFRGAGGSMNGVGQGSVQNVLSATNVLDQVLPGGFSYFGKVGDSFTAAARAIASEGTVKLVSRPRIQTSHGLPGSFFVGDTVPYITGSSFGDFSGTTRSQYTQLEVGIRLDVTPWINPEGLVVMEIEQTIDALGPTVEIDGNDVPTTTSRIAAGTVAVRDKETIILGGFIKSDNQLSHSGVPILKDIPILGYLFRTNRKSNQRTEMLVLMRPTVLTTPEAASLKADEDRNLMKGIQEIEKDFQEEREQIREGKGGFFGKR